MAPGDPPRRSEDLFHDALPLDAAARARLLDTHCGQDPELRREIEQMLAIADRRPDLLRPPGELEVPGRLGRYELRSECGRGGMGVVYDAWDPQLHRRVALKVLPVLLATDPERRAAFQREARTLAALSDDRIATVHSLEEEDGVHFLTMEFVEGETLAARNRSAPLDERSILEIMREIALALEVAHGRGIVHRDLKPANIMITPAGTVKVLDFGIARGPAEPPGAPESGAPHHSGLAGTPAYMSPEQRAGGVVDARSDLWSLGCILLECLTGRPFGSEDEEPDAEGPPVLPPGTPPPVTRLLRACLAENPTERIGSAREVRARLEEALAPSPRRRAVWWAIGLGAVLLSAMVVLRRPPPPALTAVEVQDPRTARAVDAAGRTLWVRPFEDPLAHNAYAVDTEGTVTPQAQTVAVSEGAPRAVLLATAPQIDDGTLWCLDPADGAVRWRRQAAWTPPSNERGPVYYRWNTLVRWPARPDPVVATLLRDDVWYSSAVQFLSLENELLGTYYHPGPLFFCCQLEDPAGSLVLYGTNSSARFRREVVPQEGRAHCGVVLLLDPRLPDGQAFPYAQGLGIERDWTDVPAARERAYLLIPPLDPAITPMVVSVRSRESAGAREFEVMTSDHRVLRTDAALRPLWCFASPPSPAERLRGEVAPTVSVLYVAEGRTETIRVPLRF